jgi:hypothetical protein
LGGLGSMRKTIFLETSDKELLLELSSKNTEDIIAKYKPVEIAFDHAIDAERIIEMVITLSSSVAINIFSNWLYDKVKRDPHKQVKINGNNISGQNIQVIQIIQIIEKKSSD